MSVPGPDPIPEMQATRPLKIALINNLYPPYVVGGNEILARDVAEGLRARGHTVHILTGRGRDLPQDGFTHPALDIDLDHKEERFLGGLPLTAARVLQWHLLDRRTLRQVRATLAALKPDLVICWNLYMASAAPLIAARSGAAPVLAHPADKWLLYSLDDIGLLVPAHTWLQRAFVGTLRAVVQPLLKWRARPDYILAVSEFIRGLHTRAGYAPEQSRATWLGVHSGRFAAVTHPYPESRPWRLIFAGQLWAGKGPQVAIEAVRILRERAGLPQFELEIYGGGTEGFKSYLAELISRHGLEDSVRICGFAPQPELAAAFGRGDIYLFCSIWDEPFSGGLLEAMATGMPTIATTAGGTPEAVRDGENGLLVPPDDPAALADAIERLTQEPALFEAIGRAAAAEVKERWSFDAYLDRLERSYAQIVAGHRHGAPVVLGPLPLEAGSGR